MDTDHYVKALLSPRIPISSSKQRTSGSSTSRISILVVGTCDTTGIECIRSLAAHPSQPRVYAYGPAATSRLSGTVQAWCTSVIDGDYEDSNRIETFISSRKIDWVIFAGTGHRCNNTKVAIQAIIQILSQPTCSHIHALVLAPSYSSTISSTMSWWKGSKSKLMEATLFTDEAFANVQAQTTIIKAYTPLTDNHPTGHLIEQLDKEQKGQVISTTRRGMIQQSSWRKNKMMLDRADLVEWIVQQICEGRRTSACCSSPSCCCCYCSMSQLSSSCSWFSSSLSHGLPPISTTTMATNNIFPNNKLNRVVFLASVKLPKSSRRAFSL